MVGTFGGNWQGVVKAEMLAAGLQKANFADGASPDLEKMSKLVTSTVQNKIIAEFQAELTKQAREYAVDPLKKVLNRQQLDAFSSQYLEQIVDRTYTEAIQKPADQVIKEVLTPK